MIIENSFLTKLLWVLGVVGCLLAAGAVSALCGKKKKPAPLGMETVVATEARATPSLSVSESGPASYHADHRRRASEVEDGELALLNSSGGLRASGRRSGKHSSKSRSRQRTPVPQEWAVAAAAQPGGSILTASSGGAGGAGGLAPPDAGRHSRRSSVDTHDGGTGAAVAGAAGGARQTRRGSEDVAGGAGDGGGAMRRTRSGRRKRRQSGDYSASARSQFASAEPISRAPASPRHRSRRSRATTPKPPTTGGGGGGGTTPTFPSAPGHGYDQIVSVGGLKESEYGGLLDLTASLTADGDDVEPELAAFAGVDAPAAQPPLALMPIATISSSAGGSSENLSPTPMLASSSGAVVGAIAGGGGAFRTTAASPAAVRSPFMPIGGGDVPLPGSRPGTAFSDAAASAASSGVSAPTDYVGIPSAEDVIHFDGDTDLRQFPWYKPTIVSRGAAEAALRRAPAGTFLVRASKSELGCFVISYVTEKGSPAHVLLRQANDGKWDAADCDIRFDSIVSVFQSKFKAIYRTPLAR